MRPAIVGLALTAALAAQTPQLFLQTAHAGLVHSLALSPDGTLAATGGRNYGGPGAGDAAVRLWQLATGFELRTFAPAAQAVYQEAFSPRGHRLAAATDDGIYVWDVATARLLLRIPGCATAIGFSPDGRFLASTVDPNSECGPGTFTIWDLSHGGARWASLARPPGARTRDAYFLAWSFAFTADGRLLAGIAGNPLESFDLARRAETSVPGALAPVVAGAVGGAAAMARGGGVLVLRADGTVARAIRTARGTLAGLTSGAGARSPEVVLLRHTKTHNYADLFDAATGRPAASLALAFDFGMPVLRVSPDGRWLLEGGVADNQGSSTLDLVLHDLDHPALAPRRWRQVRNATAAFSRDSRRLVAATNSGRIWSLGLATGAGACSSASALHGVGAVAESAGRRWLAQAAGGMPELWDLRSGMLTETLGDAEDPLGALRFLAGTSLLLSAPPHARTQRAVSFIGSFGAQSRAPLACAPVPAPAPPGRPIPQATFGMWDTAGARPVRDYGGVAPLAVAANGAAFAVAQLGGQKVDVIGPRGALLREVDATPGVPQSTDDHVSALALSGDGRWLAVAPDDCCSKFPVRLFNLANGAASRERSFAGDSSTAVLALDGAGRRVAVASNRGELWLWNRPRNRVTTCGKLDGDPLAMRFLDATHLLVAAAPADATAEGARELKPCRGVTARVVLAPGMTTAAFSPDGRLVYTGGAGGFVAIRDAVTGAELARLVTFHNGGDWIAVAPNGFFDGSDWAWSQLLWRFGGNTFDVAPVEAYFNDFFHPGLLADLAAGRRPKPPARLADLDRRLPRVAILPPAGAGPVPIAARHVAIALTVAEAPADPARHLPPGGVRDLRLFRNGALVHLWPGAVRLRGGRARLTATVTLTAGANRFTAYAFNRDNIKSLDTPPFTLTGAPSLARKGTAIILAVGVNRYTNPDFRLRYAANDARSFAAALARASAATGAYAKIEAVTLLNAQATRAAILAALARLAPGGAQAAQPEDTVFLYFAGHGMAEGPRYYLLPHDLGYAGPRAGVNAAAIATLEQHAISDLDLERALRPIDAGRIVLVIDACNSGQALVTGDTRQGPVNSTGLAQLAYEKGMDILTASQAYQQAVESSAFRGPHGHGHGLLTYALVVRGLEQGAASRRGGSIDLRDWLNYAVREVPRLEAAPAAAAATRSFGLPAPAAAALQHPRVFYRRQAARTPLEIAPPPQPPPPSAPERLSDHRQRHQAEHQ